MTKSAHQRAIISLALAAGRVRRRFGDVLGGEGIGASQYNILRILRGARGPLAIMTIRDRMIDPQPSITRLVDRLVERGFVHREPCANDRRRTECSITGEGLAVLTRLDEPVDRRDRELTAALDTSELELLASLLKRVANPEAEDSK